MRQRPLGSRISLAVVSLAAPAALVVAACSSSLDASDYDRSCRTDADCVTAFLGDICDCACDMGAIAKSARAAYDKDRADISCSTQCGACADDHVAVCRAGTCEAEKCAGATKRCAAKCGDQASALAACACPVGTVDLATCP